MQPKLLDPAARDEVTTGRSEGDQGSDVALESLSSQNKPLLIEQAPLNFVAADVPLVPLVTLGQSARIWPDPRRSTLF